MNAIKDSIKSGRTVVGTTVTPNVDVSILADAGYDLRQRGTPCGRRCGALSATLADQL